jgi:hypothetical protein
MKIGYSIPGVEDVQHSQLPHGVQDRICFIAGLVCHKSSSTSLVIERCGIFSFSFNWLQQVPLFELM